MKFKKPLSLILISVCIIHLADYIIIPILPIYLKIDYQLRPAKIGLLISVYTLAFQLSSILAGIISDKIGRKIIILTGAIIEIIALIGFALSNTYYLFIIFQILNGLGGGIFPATIKASINDYAKAKVKAFSWRTIFANLGVALGGLFPLILTKLSYPFFFFIASFFYLSVFFITLFIPNDKQINSFSIKEFIHILKNKNFLYFNLITCLVYSIYIQLRFLLPLKATIIFNNVKLVGTIWTITSLFLVVSQHYITKYLIKKTNYFIAIILGVLSMGIGILLIGYSNTYLILLFSAIIFIIGEMLIAPSIDSITSKLSENNLVGCCFSINNLAFGLGSSIGSFSSGLLIDYYGIRSNTPYITLLIIAIILSIIIFFTHKLKIIRI